MNPLVPVILLVVHAALSVFVLTYRKGSLRGRREYTVPVILVPIFGPLMAITVESLYALDHPGAKPVELESLRVDNDILWDPFQKPSGGEDVIPLEEAILINDVPTRRKAVLNTFRDDAMSYLDVLMVARQNDDVDTTHYATIQISKIQRQFLKKLQELAKDYEKNPGSVALLDAYIDVLGVYLQSGLPEKSILRNQRSLYARLLDRKLELVPGDRQALVAKLRNYADSRDDYPAALALVDQLRQDCPDDEQTWIEALRVFVAWDDHERLQETIAQIQQQRIRWTKQGREQIRPWVQTA